VNREEKQAFVAEIGEKYRAADLLVLADYSGMNVDTMNSFRRKLDPLAGNAEFRVVKNTLSVLSLEGTPMEALSEHFTGPTAVLFGFNDPVAPAKILQDFLKDNSKFLQVKAGYFDGTVIDGEAVKALSKLPSREELLAQLLGTLQAPMSKFVGTLAALPQKFVGTLKAYEDKLKEGEA